MKLTPERSSKSLEDVAGVVIGGRTVIAGRYIIVRQAGTLDRSAAGAFATDGNRG